MASLSQTIMDTSVAEGSVMAWWLGGTGFVFKTPAGTQIYIDPYLSNVVAGIFGVERGFPAPITAEDVRPDLVISTHWHEDHLDPGSIPVIARQSNVAFMCPPTARSRALGWGVAPDRVQNIQAGETHQFKDVKLEIVPARHVTTTAGWETPDAVGVIFEFGGLRVYHSGDTEYDLRLRSLKHKHIHVAMVVINGAGGNMDAHEAALLVWHLGVKLAIPMHHVLWKDFTGGPEATLDPYLFESTYRKLGGSGTIRSLMVGEGIKLSAQQLA
jgi:L-ascorbate metabolism protein UlaG (beta-lactamase superfamily)